MVKILAERYDMIYCGENYYSPVSEIVTEPEIQPGLCYFNTMADWKEFVTRSPEEYARCMHDNGKGSGGV